MPIPRYYRQIRPTGQAPVGGAAMAEAQAQAGVGATIAQAGSGIKGYANTLAGLAAQEAYRGDSLAASRAFRKLNQWQRDYVNSLPQRREELNQLTVDPAIGANVSGYGQELSSYPSRLNAEYDKVAADLSDRARQILETRFNTHAPVWSDQAVVTLQQLEAEDIAAEMLSLAAMDQASEAHQILEQNKALYSPAQQEKLATQIDEAATAAAIETIQGILSETARQFGWDAAQAQIDDPEFQKAVGLDMKLAESRDLHNILKSFADSEKARAAKHAEMQAEKAADELHAQAMRGFDDRNEEAAFLAGLPDRVANNVLSPAEAESIQKLLTHGPPEIDSDPATEAISQAMDQFAAGRISQAQLKSIVRQHQHDLTPTTKRRYIEQANDFWSKQNQGLREVEQYAAGQFITDDSLIVQMMATPGLQFDLATFMKDERPRQKQIVRVVLDHVEAWLKDNPQASPDQIEAYGMREVNRVRDLEQVGQHAYIAAWEAALVPKPPVQEFIVPGLESIWGELDDEGKAGALNALQKGFTPEQLVEHYRKGRP